MHYHMEAYRLVFRKGFMNLVKLMLFSVILLISFALPILAPIAIIASVSFFKAFLEKGEADLFETLRGVDMTADRYLRLLIAALLQLAVILAGFFLFFIPGVYFAFALAPLFFILTMNPDITTSDAFKQSFAMMDGNKLKLFLLRLLGLVVPMVISLLIVGIAQFLPRIGALLMGIYLLISPLIFAEIMIVDMMFFKEISEKTAINELTKDSKPIKLPKSVEVVEPASESTSHSE